MRSAGSSAPRPRPQRICNTCARRKVGCDKVRPSCGRCQRAGLECSYGSGSLQQTPLRFVDETASVISEQQSATDRVARLDQLMSSYAGHQQALSSETSLQNIATEDVGHLYESPDQSTRFVAPSFFALISDEIAVINDLLQTQMSSTQTPAAAAAAATTWDNPISAGVPSFSSSIGSSATHRRRASQHRHLYGDIFPDAPAWAFVQPLSAPTVTAQDSQYTHVALTELDRDQVWTLVWAYISGWHTVTPVFHGPSFLAKIHDFHKWKSGEIVDYVPDMHFLALRAAVLFAGSVVCPRQQLIQTFGIVDRETLSHNLYEEAVKAIRRASFPHSPSLESFAAFLIVDSTWLREEEPLTCISFVGLAVRIAQMLGLHKNSSKFPGLSDIEVEVRRRIWRQVLYVDCQVAAASGLPPLISPGTFDIQPVSETPENLLSAVDEEKLFEPRSILGTFQAGRNAFYLTGNQVLHILHNAFLDQDGIRRILDLLQELNAEFRIRRNQIREAEQTALEAYPTVHDAEHLISRSESNRRLASYARFLFGMMAMKPYSMLYGQVKRQGLLKYFLELEPNLVAKCRRFLHSFLILVQCSEFQPWHWCWPGVHQPLHAVMAIIQDLNDNPLQPAANVTRELVDLAFRLSGSSGNGGILSAEGSLEEIRRLHEGGSAAWTFVWQARQRAWQKAGFDASELVCPERARDIAIDYDDDIMPETGEDERPSALDEQAVWGTVPQSAQDWIMYGQATDPYFGFDPDGQYPF